MAWRIDRSRYAKPKRLPSGFLVADAVFTRTGVFVYENADGSERRELRLPEEVFAEDSLSTLAMAPVTIEHPREPVTPKNVTQYSKGAVGSDVRPDAKDVRGTIAIHDAEAIEAVEGGDRRELSCGYWADAEHAPGSYQGERYDYVQRNIRYNHVALTVEGRAGPGVRVYLDSEGAEMVSLISDHTKPPERRNTMEFTLILDSVDYKTDNQALYQAVTRELARKDAVASDAQKAATEAKAVADEATARADGLKVDLDKEKAAREDAEDPAKIQERMKARLGLERKAAGILGEDVKLDSMTDQEIRVAVIKKHDPEAALDEASEAYIQGRFDSATKSFAEGKDKKAGDSLDATRRAGAHPKPTHNDSSTDARKKFVADTHAAWKNPLHQKAAD